MFRLRKVQKFCDYVTKLLVFQKGLCFVELVVSQFKRACYWPMVTQVQCSFKSWKLYVVTLLTLDWNSTVSVSK
jgi:hypothetical protein